MRLRRLGRVLLVTAALALSALSFPQAAAWLVAAWIGWYACRLLTNKRAWPSLFACAAVVLAKRLPLLPGLQICLVAMFVVAAVDVLFDWKRIAPSRLGRWARVAILGAAWMVLAIDWQTSTRCGPPMQWSEDRPIVCLGDSLTSGIGRNQGYASELQSRIKPPVVGVCHEGYTSRQAIDKLLPQAMALHPQAVVLEIGGHDFLFKHTRDELETNLRRLIESFQDAGAEVVLVEIPRGFVSDRFAGIERRLAREYDLQLVPDTVIRRLVLWSPMAPPGLWLPASAHLSDDGLHPNHDGNQVLADAAAAALAQRFGSSLLRIGN